MHFNRTSQNDKSLWYLLQGSKSDMIKYRELATFKSSMKITVDEIQDFEKVMLQRKQFVQNRCSRYSFGKNNNRSVCLSVCLSKMVGVLRHLPSLAYII